MANIQQSPSLTAKLKTRNAANRMKHGSPKLQEVLRQKCRQRMREKRGRLFNDKRQGIMETDENLQRELTEIVRQELSQLGNLNVEGFLVDGDNSDPMTQEEALAREDELLMEEQEWILQEYMKLQNEEDERLALYAEDSLREQVVCPLCEKGVIAEVGNLLTCPNCNMQLPRTSTVDEFGDALRYNVATHSSLCSEQPSFMLVPENTTTFLYLTCDKCSVFSVIV